jgi:hypothetical protein
VAGQRVSRPVTEEEVRREVAYRARRCVEDFQVEQKLLDAICRLPENARELALERCYFVAITAAQGGFYISPQSPLAGDEELQRTLVVLNGAGSWRTSRARWPMRWRTCCWATRTRTSARTR